MAANEIKWKRWSFQLVSRLTGEAQQAYAALSPTKTYDTVTEAILRQCGIDEDVTGRDSRDYDQRRESLERRYTRLKDLATYVLDQEMCLAKTTGPYFEEQFLAMLQEDSGSY